MLKSYDEQRKELSRMRTEYQKTLETKLNEVQSGMNGKVRLSLMAIGGGILGYVIYRGVKSIMGKEAKKTNPSGKPNPVTEKIKEQAGLALLNMSQNMISNFLDKVNK
jgi:hypothetical protein